MKKALILILALTIFIGTMAGCGKKDNSSVFKVIKGANQDQRENYVSILDEVGLSSSYIEEISKTNDNKYNITSSIYEPVTMTLQDDTNIESLYYNDLPLYDNGEIVNTIQKIEKKEEILPLFNALDWITPQLAESYYNVLCGENDNELDTYATRIEQNGNNSFNEYMNNYDDPCVVNLNEDKSIKDVTYHDKPLYKNGNFVTKFVTIANEEYFEKTNKENSTSASEESNETPVKEDKPDTEATQNIPNSDKQLVFSPQDVSDATIKSIQTYNDYLKMYEMIILDYFANYEVEIKGTVLYSEESFAELKSTYEDSFEQQKDIYGAMGNTNIIGKDDLVKYLIDFRDSLKEYIESIKESLG